MSFCLGPPHAPSPLSPHSRNPAHSFLPCLRIITPSIVQNLKRRRLRRATRQRQQQQQHFILLDLSTQTNATRNLLRSVCVRSEGASPSSPSPLQLPRRRRAPSFSLSSPRKEKHLVQLHGSIHLFAAAPSRPACVEWRFPLSLLLFPNCAPVSPPTQVNGCACVPSTDAKNSPPSFSARGRRRTERL